MYYIDPHIHMVSRTTDDYETLAKMGCVAVSEPAFWAGYDRGSVLGFRVRRKKTEGEQRGNRHALKRLRVSRRPNHNHEQAANRSP